MRTDYVVESPATRRAYDSDEMSIYTTTTPCPTSFYKLVVGSHPRRAADTSVEHWTSPELADQTNQCFAQCGRN